MKRTDKALASDMSKKANAGMTKDDSKTATRLLEKSWSPLLVRKYQVFNWPLFIGIICDASMSDLDEVVYKAIDKAEECGFRANDLQAQRNFCGLLSDEISDYYNSIKRGCVEGLSVIAYWDKCFVSSCAGDLMQHEKCVNELYLILNMMTKI